MKATLAATPKEAGSTLEGGKRMEVVKNEGQWDYKHTYPNPCLHYCFQQLKVCKHFLPRQLKLITKHVLTIGLL